MRGRERKEELKEMEKEHRQRRLYLRSKRMEKKNKKKTTQNIHMVSYTRSHSTDWNHMLTDTGNNGKLELFNLFSRFVALGRGVGEMAGVEGIRD